MKRLLGLRPHAFLSVLLLVFSVAFLPDSIPVFCLSFLFFALGTLEITGGARPVESSTLGSPVGATILLAIGAATSEVMGFLGWHGRTIAVAGLSTLLISATIYAFTKRTAVRDEILREWTAADSRNIVVNLMLLSWCGVFWLYSYKAWHIRGFNSPLSHYVHQAQMLLKTGEWVFPKVGAYDNANDNFWYPNFLTHLFAIFGSLRDPTQLRIDQGFVGTWFAHVGAIATLRLGALSRLRLERWAAVLWVLTFVSYTFFNHAGPEAANDSPMYLFAPAVATLWVSFLERKNPNIWLLAFAISVAAGLYRLPTAVILATASVMIGSWKSLRERGGRNQEDRQASSMRVDVKVLVVSSLLLLAPLPWYAQLLRLHGNPLFPHRPTSLEKLGVPGNPLRTFRGNQAIREDKAALIDDLSYHLLALPKDKESRTPLKILRGFLHGLTYSSATTLLVLLAVASFARKKRNAPDLDENLAMASLAMIASLVGVSAIFGFYFKFLLLLFLPYVLLAPAVFADKLRIQLARLPRLARHVPPTVVTLMFGVSFAYAGMGAEPIRWTPLKCLLSPSRPCEGVKDHDWYRAAEIAHRVLDRTGGRVLIVHIEPGHYINTLYPMRWHHEEVSFQSPATEKLHCAKSEVELFRILREMQIKVISSVFEPFLERYIATSSPNCPELLSKMLLSRSKSLSWISDQVAALP